VINVLIADDHAIVRLGLKELLAETSDIVVVGEAASGPEVLEKIRKERYDVIVLDISMPGASGLDILAQLKKGQPKTSVLFLSIHPEEQYAVRALKAGASGYVTKESAPEELVAAIRKVSKGRTYVSASLAEWLATTVQSGSNRALHEFLSNREYQVLRMIAMGRSVKEIAASLFLSAKTVNTYRSRVFSKME